jgi:hypothetical protein
MRAALAGRPDLLQLEGCGAHFDLPAAGDIIEDIVKEL